MPNRKQEQEVLTLKVKGKEDISGNQDRSTLGGSGSDWIHLAFSCRRIVNVFLTLTAANSESFLQIYKY